MDSRVIQFLRLDISENWLSSTGDRWRSNFGQLRNMAVRVPLRPNQVPLPISSEVYSH